MSTSTPMDTATPQPAPSGSTGRIEMYDTTLRDGSQGESVAFSLVDKINIAQLLDDLGFDYIEGGYPLSNPKDAAFFEQAKQIQWKHAKVCAFGMTRRKGVSAADDIGMNALIDSKAPVIIIVGKTWDLHVEHVLNVSEDENLAMIRDSLATCNAAEHVEQVFYDAEHFFDGYKANPTYAIKTLTAAIEGGATRLVLCDTNGGSLPGFIKQTVTKVRDELAEAMGDHVKLGIHTHNDGGLAVANALAAVEAGCVQVQGTINGIGERCGNCDLTTIAGNLLLKLGYQCLADDALTRLTEVSRFVYETANMPLWSGQPFVGRSAFAHKGGMHVHAVRKFAHSYEHIDPQAVGNTRRVLVSELSGASNVAETMGEKFNIASDRDMQRKVLQRVQDLEHQGYQFEAAKASFELLVREIAGDSPQYWTLDHYRCVILKRDSEPSSTEAIVKLDVNGKTEHRVAEGDGPVNALDAAVRKCLLPHYPQLKNVNLTDFKVRVVNPTAASAAKVRVMAEFAMKDTNDGPVARRFTTIGVNENIVDASWEAITSALRYFLAETSAKPEA